MSRNGDTGRFGSLPICNLHIGLPLLNPVLAMILNVIFGNDTLTTVILLKTVIGSTALASVLVLYVSAQHDSPVPGLTNCDAAESPAFMITSAGIVSYIWP